ncbi:hypothetical protein Mgra_00002898 [Meloidogyne graminicola]|uniref:Uncharacterized protein n=1 Tax=Meloidogyne graminicola TaxID=189291 RepID=A0A8S9ZWJ8_9BILA|nr:hypothetical protein Mgra_00002898 [Meloidogyne graminicola]
MFNIKLNNINKEGCKQYGINCNSEDKSIKLYKENIKYIEHFNEIDQSIKSMLKNTSIHKELYTKEENNPKYYRANSSSLLIKKSNEGLIPLELIKTKLNGTIKLPLEKDEKN